MLQRATRETISPLEYLESTLLRMFDGFLIASALTMESTAPRDVQRRGHSVVND
jgi:hypothetical protein